MGRLRRSAECEAAKALERAWPLRRTTVDAASFDCRVALDTPVVVTLAEINRAYRYGVEDGREDAEGRRAPVEVMAFGNIQAP